MFTPVLSNGRSLQLKLVRRKLARPQPKGWQKEKNGQDETVSQRTLKATVGVSRTIRASSQKGPESRFSIFDFRVPRRRYGNQAGRKKRETSAVLVPGPSFGSFRQPLGTIRGCFAFDFGFGFRCIAVLKFRICCRRLVGSFAYRSSSIQEVHSEQFQ